MNETQAESPKVCFFKDSYVVNRRTMRFFLPDLGVFPRLQAPSRRFDGIALAPGQIVETATSQASVRALGINDRSSLLFQEPAAGLEYSQSASPLR